MHDIVLIVAFVRENRCKYVHDALEKLELTGWSETNTHGHGRAQHGVTQERVRIEIMLPASRAAECAASIARAAHTGSDGDGIVLTIPVLGVERISDLSVGPVAL